MISCFVTPLSSLHMANFDSYFQVDSWDGTVSVALFISSYDILGKIERLKRKFSTMPSNILEKLSVHVVFYSNETCRLQSVAYLNDTTDRLYPANVVRNIARMYVHSKYILPTDYEFVFSKDFEGKMRALADRELTRNPKMVLVSRTFEVSDTVKRLPRVKDPLYSLYRAGQAVEFHARYYPGAHKISGIDGWFAHKESEKASINSVLKLQKASWEPQFVSFSTIPLHDENFPYSIRDNSVLRWEMCRQNYTFAIVNDVFMVHRGIKLPRDIANTSAAQKKLKPQFKQALKLFTQRMKETYPETAASCPKFTA
ncbi:hypothetical protein AB6A40_004933 [Gnathostoma spinigerum]|uniref:Glycosyltransferase family 92 protein n=1 Tax=Gnathostoma spinigerum TaxID=75299 RepID=A0ABD6EDZ1_9BILA